MRDACEPRFTSLDSLYNTIRNLEVVKLVFLRNDDLALQISRVKMLHVTLQVESLAAYAMH